MMRKILVVLLCMLLVSCDKQKVIETYDINTINVVDDSEALKLDLDLYSDKYLLFDVSNLKTIYAYKQDEKMYPASLTKLMTLDVVLNCVQNLNDTSNITQKQKDYLIEEDASIAGLQVEYEYSINDLLYALILPSGADAALALENYFSSMGLDLVEQMNIRAANLNLTNSHFCNTTGLHDDNHYSSLNDIFKIVMDVLSFEQGRNILETITYKLEDGLKLDTTLKYMRNKKALILGGKTGYTPEAGQNICVLYRANNRSYILLLGNAPRKSYRQTLHFDDSVEIFNALY